MPHVGCNNKGHGNSLESSSLMFSWHLPKRSPGMLSFHQSHNPQNWLEEYRPYKENDSSKEEEEEEDISKEEEEAEEERKKKNVGQFIFVDTVVAPMVEGKRLGCLVAGRGLNETK